MIKTIRISLIAAIGLSSMVTFAPAAQARFDSDLFDSLLKEIYSESDRGDAGDITVIIARAIDEHSEDDLELVKALIKRLKKNRDRLAEFVSDEDLDRVFKKLRKKINRQRAMRNSDGGGNQGPINGSESNVVNP